ncbi:MAG: type II toxin-antitoxin system RelE/ParE family toxin [Bacteroidetes bacterium]|nr:type II toxin-antitoxin system RelE/ParE family toxin [Bacteroidota bacterium]
MVCHISEQAARDLEDIFDYTEDEFGLHQAVTYITSFDDVFFRLSHHPQLGKERNEIKKGLFSVLHESHVVFYRIKRQHIMIVRILHGSRDLPHQFV